MTLTQNLEFLGPSGPTTTVLIREGTTKSQCIKATTDVASKFHPGILCYLTGGTQANDMTPATAAFGKTSLVGGHVFVTEIEPYSPDYAKSFMCIDNTDHTGDITDYYKAAERPLRIRSVEIGMWFWALLGYTAAGAATYNEVLIVTTDGYLASVGDSDGVAIDQAALGFRCLATVASANWVPVEYIGQWTHDKTA